MLPFRNYSEHDSGLPVVGLVSQPDSPSLYDKPYRDEINGELAETTEVHFHWPLAGLEAIGDVLSEYGLTLPDINLDEESGEHVFLIKDFHEIESDTVPKKEDLFLYLFHDPTEEGEIEFYAEIVNEAELEELLDELNSDEEENDYADNDDEHGPERE